LKPIFAPCPRMFAAFFPFTPNRRSLPSTPDVPRGSVKQPRSKAVDPFRNPNPLPRQPLFRASR
jgi:hypothetical protein